MIFLFDIVFETLASVITQENEMQLKYLERKEHKYGFCMQTLFL